MAHTLPPHNALPLEMLLVLSMVFFSLCNRQPDGLNMRFLAKGNSEDLFVRRSHHLPIEVAPFINNTTILVGIPPGMMFALNIDWPRKVGRYIDEEESIPRPRWDGYQVVDQLLLGPFGVRNKVLSYAQYYQTSILHCVPDQECHAENDQEL